MRSIENKIFKFETKDDVFVNVGHGVTIFNTLSQYLIRASLWIFISSKLESSVLPLAWRSPVSHCQTIPSCSKGESFDDLA